MTTSRSTTPDVICGLCAIGASGHLSVGDDGLTYCADCKPRERTPLDTLLARHGRGH